MNASAARKRRAGTQPARAKCDACGRGFLLADGTAICPGCLDRKARAELIADLHRQGQSTRAIAIAVRTSPATVHRVITRVSSGTPLVVRPAFVQGRDGKDYPSTRPPRSYQVERVGTHARDANGQTAKERGAAAVGAMIARLGAVADALGDDALLEGIAWHPHRAGELLAVLKKAETAIATWRAKLEARQAGKTTDLH